MKSIKIFSPDESCVTRIEDRHKECAIIQNASCESRVYLSRKEASGLVRWLELWIAEGDEQPESLPDWFETAVMQVVEKNSVVI